jgi:hypothetical protein
MKELEAVNDLLESDSDIDLLSVDEDSEGRNFRFEYAHESLTERSSCYKRRSHNV